MDTIFAKVAGLDVHQKFITVGIRCRLDTGKLFAEVRTYGTMTRDLLALADSLQALGVTPIVFGTGFARYFTRVEVAFGVARTRGWRDIRRNP